MIEYIVIEHFNLKEFIEKVNEKIQEGWKCQGGINAVNFQDCYYMQALIKDEDNDPI